jgi:hypothetical protein
MPPDAGAIAPGKNSDRGQRWYNLAQVNFSPCSQETGLLIIPGDFVNLHEVLNLAKQLSPVDKIRLMQQMAFELESELRDKPTPPQQHQQPQQPPQSPQEPPHWESAHAAQRPSPPDIDPARWDDWASFPD